MSGFSFTWTAGWLPMNRINGAQVLAVGKATKHNYWQQAKLQSNLHWQLNRDNFDSSGLAIGLGLDNCDSSGLSEGLGLDNFDSSGLSEGLGLDNLKALDSQKG